MRPTGIKQKDFEILNKLVIDPLKRVGAQVWLYGSRARGDHKKFSDVDILVKGENLGPTLSVVKENIEESKFPYKIDIVLVENLAKSYIPSIFSDRLEL